MKLACLTSLGILIGLLTLHTLFAQSNTISLNQWNEEGNQYSNISSYTKSSNFAPQMQMDPGIVEGIEDILRHDKFRKVIEEHSTSTLFTIRDNGNICSKKVVGSVSSSSCSNQVLRLRGGGLQQSRPKGELKNTGDTSDKEI
ncbi:MAG TPA: hypothetical protein VJK54_11750, partial [Chthoniobacterales bacterium]|nr:hypothetical protein [Chthoniobacterales bacterium]